MKVFVTGVAGQLGHDVINELAKRNSENRNKFEYVASDLAPAYAGIDDNTAVVKAPYVSLDITDENAVKETLTRINPDAVIHCAAWTAVDLAEDEENKELVHKVNVVGTKNIVKVVKELDEAKPDGCKMIYISTDYVFDGNGEQPWEADCKDYAPLNMYGKTKLEGELAVSELLDKYFIVRIAWVFGQNGKNFIKTMLTAGKMYDKLTVVCDQVGTPTYTYDLSGLLCDMIISDKYGYYHATNSEVHSSDQNEKNKGISEEGCKLGYISWYDFTKEIFRIAVELGHTEYSEDRVTVLPVTTAEYGITKAERPFNSRLDKKKLIQNGFNPLPTWQDALRRYLEELDF